MKIPLWIFLAPATAAHGEENVVAEPGGEGDVPTLPEFSDIPGEIGKAKFFINSKPNNRAQPSAISLYPLKSPYNCMANQKIPSNNVAPLQSV